MAGARQKDPPSMKVLVTGGAGFIGSHLVDALIARDHEVAVVDDLSTGNARWLNPRAAFHEMDIRHPDLDSLIADAQPHVLFHQAARANVRESMEKPLLYADVNVLGSLNLLECCRRHQVRKVVYASTGGAVYGEPQRLPVTEHHPVRPLDPYGASKLFVEHYLYLYHANFGVRFTALRYPNVYGPRQDPYGEAGVVAIFTRQMLAGDPPLINGTGEQERDFMHVSDVVRANLRALEQGDNGIFNVGQGHGTSVLQIYDSLSRLTGFEGDRVHGPAKQGEVFKIYLDASLARRELGWEPRVSLADGLASTVDFFRGEMETEVQP